MSQWNNRKTENMLKAFLMLEKMSEARCFFRDLLTEREIIELGNRWRAAQLLDRAVSYDRIQAETGLSTRTIARISKWLRGGTGGYRNMLDKMQAHHPSSSGKRPAARGK